VTKEEAESGKVIDICLKEIDGSRPFFICLLGNRYGWVPGDDEIPAETYRHYTKLGDKKECSVTHLEILHAVLDPLTSVDITEETPHAFFYFREATSLSAPEPDNQQLWTMSEEQRAEYRKTFFETDPSRQVLLDKLKADIREHYQVIGEKNGNRQEIEERIFTYSPTFSPFSRNPRTTSS